jgi:hypothetical protein
MMNRPEVTDKPEKRERRTVQLAEVYIVTFIKLPVWLPALK